MVKALSDAGLVEYSPRVGVQLTEPGRKLALHVLRRHRLIEQFLVEVLGFDCRKYEEAEQMEHVVSDLLLERIDRYLGIQRRIPMVTQSPSGGRTNSWPGGDIDGCPLQTTSLLHALVTKIRNS